MQKEQLASRLDSLPLPLSSLYLSTQLLGIFSPPQQWKSTDQLNPNIFTYTARFLSHQYLSGKIHPRQLTDKELREQEENTKKKGAPGAGKKETKDPVEEERIRKLREEELEAEGKRNEEEAKMGEEERFYVVSEDPYRGMSVKFEGKSSEGSLEGKGLVVFEERVGKDGGEWIYVFKHPSVSEEEIAKLKKAKSKNLNINDLNPVTLRGWVDLSQFTQPNTTSITIRCKLFQVDQTPQTSKPNIQKTYLTLRLNLSTPLTLSPSSTPQITSSSLILPYPPTPTLAPDLQSVKNFQDEIKVILESIAMQFSSSNWKQLNATSQLQTLQPLTLPKQSDRTRRTQQFLYEFNVKGMYKIMKERVKKVVVKICKNKFKDELEGYTSVTGVTKDAKDQFYSEIYSFLIKQYQLVLKQIIQEKKEDLYLTPVESARVYKADVDKYIQQRINQTESQRTIRLVGQNESLLKLEEAKEIFEEGIRGKAIGEGLDLKFEYVKFCLRNNLVGPSKLVKIVYEVLQGDRRDEVYLLYMLLLFAGGKKGEYKKGWVFLKELVEKEEEKVEYLMMARLVFESLMGDEKLAEKYYRVGERVVLRRLGALPAVGEHRTNPAASEIPTLKQNCQYSNSLTPEEIDEHLNTPLLTLLSSFHLLPLLSLLLPKFHNPNHPLPLYTSLLLNFSTNPSLALQRALSLNASSPSYLLTKLITQISFSSTNYQLCQHHLKSLFRYKQTLSTPSTYLQLATIYLKKNELLNAKACLIKLIQKDKNNSLAWGMLGNVQFKLGDMEMAVGCLREANVLNPGSHEVWYMLCEVYLRERKMCLANSCLVNSIRLRKVREYGFGESLGMVIRGMKWEGEGEKEVAELMLENLRALSEAR